MEELIPSVFYLSQNSPNPFKTYTKIKYCLPIKAQVYLNVYNSEGNIIKKLVDKTQDAGTYEIEFNSYDLPGGDYYFQIQANELHKESELIFNKSKKMILIR